MAKRYQSQNVTDYWEKRSIEVANQRYKDVVEFEEILQKEYNNQFKEIENSINSFILKYAEENQLTFEVAEKRLSRIEFADYRQRMEQLTKKLESAKGTPLEDVIKGEIRKIQGRRSVSRLQAMKDEIQLRMSQITVDEQRMVENFLKEQYVKTFDDVQEYITKPFGTEKLFDTPSLEAIAPIVQYPYSGIMFSEAIWKANDKLISNLTNVLTAGIVQGKSIDKMTRELKEKMYGSNKNGNYSTFDVRRIVRTESNFIQERAKHNTNVEYEVEKYIIVSATDKRCCGTCTDKDDKVYNEGDRTEGVNAPPFHPQCRCTTAPYVSDEELEAFSNLFIKKMQERKGAPKVEPQIKPEPITKPTPKPKPKPKAKPKVIPKPLKKVAKSNIPVKADNFLKKYRACEGGSDVPQWYLDEAIEKLDNAPDNIKQVWNKYEHLIEFDNVNSKYNHFNLYTGKVCVNFEYDTADNYERKHAVLFHELGHLFDYKPHNSEYGKFSILEERFGKTLRKEGKAYTKKFFEDHDLTDLKHGERAWELEKFFRDNYDMKDFGDVSDLIEGATNGSYNMGAGHGREYWKDKTKLPSEGFATMFSATLMNDEGRLKWAKEIFPKSYDIFLEILEGMINE